MRVRTYLIEVIWRWSRLNWQVVQHYIDGRREGYISQRRKVDAEAEARALGRELGRSQGREHPIQLHIKDRLGRIQEEASYGSDDPRIPG